MNMKVIKYKRIPVLFVILGLICGILPSEATTIEMTGAAYAAQLSGGRVKLHGTVTGGSHAMIAIDVYREGKGAADLFSGAHADNMDILFYHDQILCDENGDFETTFQLSGEPGIYTTKFGGANIKDVVFEYRPDSVDEIQLLLDFNDTTVSKGGWDSASDSWGYEKKNGMYMYGGKPLSHGFSTLSKNIVEPLTEGLYRMTFDYYMESVPYSTYVLARSSQGERIELFHFSTVCQTDSAGQDIAGSYKAGAFPDVTGYTLETTAPYFPNQLCRTEILLDMDDLRVYWYVDGQYYGETSIPQRFTDIANIQFAVNGMPGDAKVYFDNVRLAKITAVGCDLPEPLRYGLWADINCGLHGNIADGGEITFAIKGKTRCRQGPQGVLADVILRDKKGNEKYDDELYMNIDEGAFAAEIICPPLPYGLYEAELTLKDDKGIVQGYSKKEFAVANISNGTGNKQTGVSTHFLYRSVPETMLEVVGGSGVGLIRDDLRWSEYEKEYAGNYQMPDRIQQVLNWAENHHTEVMLILGSNNDLYADTRPPSTPEALEKFGAYCYEVALETRGQVQYFEVWNEYNLVYDRAENQATTEFTAENYANILKTAYRNVKRANPEALVFLGGLGRVGSPLDEDYAWMSKLLPMFEGEKCFDAVSVHPYRFVSPEEGEFVGTLAKFKEYMAQQGYGDIPLWISEMGWPSFTKGVYDISEELQAEYMIRMLGLNDIYGLAENVTWYDLENDGEDISDSESNFGLVHKRTRSTPNAAKAAYLAFANYNTMTADFVPGKGYKKEDGTYLAAYQKGTDRIYICWNDATETQLSLTELADGKIATVYDIYGNREADSENVTVGERPIYIFITDINLSFAEDRDSALVVKARITEEIYRDQCGENPFFCVSIIDPNGVAGNIYSTEGFTLKNHEYQAEIRLDNSLTAVSKANTITAYLWSDGLSLNPLVSSIKRRRG